MNGEMRYMLKNNRIGLYYNYTNNGPGKVISNLKKGLDNNGYIINDNIDGDFNIILQNCSRLNDDLTDCIIGPNICTLPIDNKKVMDLNYYKIIVPSKWVMDLYSKWIPVDKIKIWSVGIDTDLFSDKSNFNKKYDFLIYFKRRSINELNYIINLIQKQNKNFVVVEYGKYNQNNFIQLISESKMGIVIDNCESQGIAIQEMMSCNLPLLVWDVDIWLDRGHEYQCPSTSIPYWDEKCGEFFYDLKDFEFKLNLIENGDYSPRNFILKNFNIKEQSKKLIDMFGYEE